MKRSLFTKHIKQTLLAVPAAALMLGAAQAGTTIGLNFQSWYYDSGNTPQTVGYGAGYQTTGFPVTAKAFGVDTANWFNTDPIACSVNKGGVLPIDLYATFGGVNTNFAGSLSAYMTAPNAWESAIGEQVAGFHPETVAPGNDEVTWSYLDSSASQSPAVSVSGLAAKFPNGYVIQTIAAEADVSSFNDVDISDGVTTNTVAYSTYFVTGSASDGYYSGNGTVGLSAPSGKFTADTINITCQPQTSPNRSTLAGFIITDKPVVSQSPASAAYLVGQPIHLSVVAIGIQSLGYQWRSNGIPLSGATTTGLSVPSDATGVFNFDVVVTNLYGSATSDVAMVTVAIPANLTWDADTGTTGAQDGSGTWDVGVSTNWWNGSNNVGWGNLDNAVFGAGGTGAYTINVASGVAASSLTINSGAYTFTNSGISLGGASQIGVNNNASAVIVSPISGTSGLTKGGNGTVTLAAGEPYTGNTVVSAGTLSLGVGGGGGTLQGNLTVNSNATVLCNVNNALGYSGTFWVTNINLNFGTLATSVTTDNGWGLQVHMTGATMSATVPGGYFAMGASPVVNVTGTNIPSVISADMTVRDAAPGGIVFNVTRGTAAADLKITGSLRTSGTGGITLNGGGITELSGANTYAGGTTVNAGTLTVSGQLTGDGMITLADNTTLIVTGRRQYTGHLPLPPPVLHVGTGAGANTLGFAGLSSTNVAPITHGWLCEFL